MCFPNNMTFQYFFFDTYPGYFLQVFPIALIVSLIYGIIRFKGKNEPKEKILTSCIFICYLSGLICLVILKDIISNFWYELIFHMDNGSNIQLFVWDVNLIPDFWTHINEEMIGNILMFLPFGILYSLYKKAGTVKNTLLAGLVLTIIIECLQPIFGRAFDINDIIMNFTGIVFSTGIFFLINKK